MKKYNNLVETRKGWEAFGCKATSPRHPPEAGAPGQGTPPGFAESPGTETKQRRGILVKSLVTHKNTQKI